MVKTTTIFVGYQSRRADVWSVYEAKGIIKAVTGSAWNPDDRLWTVPSVHAETLAKALRVAGFPCTVTRERAPDLLEGRGLTWAYELLMPLSCMRRKAAYHALVKVIHPDSGGDTELMKALNCAYDDLGGD